MSLPTEKQGNLVSGIVNANVTFDSGEDIIFVGALLEDEEEEQIRKAVDVADIWEPDSKVTRIDLQ